MKAIGRFRPLLIALLLALATLLLFARAAGNEFVLYDDNIYVTENPPVQQGLTWSGVAWAFTTMHAGNWHPLTWLSHMLDVQLFGLAPGPHHLVNVLLHAANAVLLYLILLRMTGAPWRSAFVAALFAVHPLHVESVAWVAERKDVLSGLFGLLTIGAYARYAERPGAARYAWTVLMLAIGLLCKPMLVTVPLLLLLLDYWPLGRMAGAPPPFPGADPDRPQAPLTRLVVEKIPMLALCTASSAVTVVAQGRSDAITDLSLGLGARVANAAAGYVRYLGKTFFPGSLSVFYPLPPSGVPSWQVAVACLLLVFITAMVLLRLRRSPWLAVGWFWFAGMLVPVIGLVQVGAQSIADRYTYLPLIGVFVMVAWEAPELLRRRRIRPNVLGAAAVAAIVALAALSWRQTGFWKTHETLFRHALDVTTNNWLAHESLGEFLGRKGDVDEALVHIREALRLSPEDARAWYNLGVLQRKTGRYSDAVGSLREALRLRPRYANAWSNLGAVYESLGLVPEASGALREAVRIAPGDPAAWYNLGSFYGQTGFPVEAAKAFEEAVRIQPDFAAAWNNLGLAYRSSARIPEAADAFRQATRARPGDPVAWYNLGLLYAGTGRRREALEAARALQAVDSRLAVDLLRRIGPGP